MKILFRLLFFFPKKTLLFFYNSIYLDKEEERLRNKCLKMRSFIQKTKYHKKKFYVDPTKKELWVDDLNKIKNESYQLDIQNKLDKLITE